MIINYFWAVILDQEYYRPIIPYFIAETLKEIPGQTDIMYCFHKVHELSSNLNVNVLKYEWLVKIWRNS